MNSKSLQNNEFSLVLGGGSARGIAHLGVLQFLEENGLQPNEIIGTSMGAFIGAFYALGFSAKEMNAIIASIKPTHLFDPDILRGGIK